MNGNAVDKAVTWWADKLVECNYSGLSTEERRDPRSSGYQLAERLMQLGKPKVTREQIEQFSASLREQISPLREVFLDVDYEPRKYLWEACEAAGIDPWSHALPIKTGMWVSDDKVEVSYGYGAPYVML